MTQDPGEGKGNLDVQGLLGKPEDKEGQVTATKDWDKNLNNTALNNVGAMIKRKLLY